MLPDDIFHNDPINRNVPSCEHIFIDKLFPHKLVKDVIFLVSDLGQEWMVWVYLLFQGLQLL